MLYGQVRKFLGKVFHELARQKGCEIVKGGMVQDHVHIDFSALDIDTSPELKISLNWVVEKAAKAHKIDVASAPSAGTKLATLIEELGKKNL